MKLLFAIALFYFPTDSIPSVDSLHSSIVVQPYTPTELVIDSLPPLDSLHASIESYYQSELLADLSEFQESKKGEWLKYLPSVGVNYALVQTSDGTLNTRPRPTLSYSSTKLYTARKDANRKEAKINSIQSRNALSCAREKHNLNKLSKKYYLNAYILKNEYAVLGIERQLFDIQKAKYERGIILPNDFLSAYKAYLIVESSFNEKQVLLSLLKVEILSIARLM